MTQAKMKILFFALLVLATGAFFWWQILNIFTAANIRLDDVIYLGVSSLVFLIFLLIFNILAETRGIIYLIGCILSVIFVLLYLWQINDTTFELLFFVSRFSFHDFVDDRP